MRRDVYGNLVEQIVYANSATGVSESGYSITANNDSQLGDRITRLLLDSHGRAIRTEDGAGIDRYASYNARGEIAKEWQPTTNNDGVVEYLVTRYEYDKLGQQLAVLETKRYSGATTEWVATRATYNAFGEVITKSVDNMSGSEYFHYDQAGRVWRTNAGDGVHKVYLYDLAGNVTAEIRSQTRNLSSYIGSPSAALALSSADQMRTEMRYDLLGRVLEQRQVTFFSPSPTDPIAASFNLGMLDGAPRLYWTDPNEYGLTMTFRYRVAGSGGSWSTLAVTPLISGYDYDPKGSQYPVFGYYGVDLTGLTNGNYEYELTYTRAGASVAHAKATGTFNYASSIVTTLGITGGSATPVVGSYAGMLSTNRIGLAWADISGWSWSVQVISQATGQVTTITPSAYQVMVESGKGPVAVPGYAAYLDGLAVGTYSYQIVGSYNGAIQAAESGVVTVTGASTSTTASGVSPAPAWPSIGTVSASVSTIPPASAGIASSAYYDPYAIFDPKLGYFGGWVGTNQVNASWANVGSGTVRVYLEYYTANGAYAVHDQNYSNVGTGMAVTWYNDLYASDGGISSIYRLRVLDLAGNVLRDTWNGTSTTQITWPASTGQLVTFAYKPAGSSSWTERTVSASGGNHFTTVPGIGAGYYDYQITYWNVVNDPKIGDIPYEVASASGQFYFSGSSAQVVSQQNTPAAYLSGVYASGSSLHWSAQAGDSVSFQYMAPGSSSYTSGSVSASGGNYSFNFYGMASGTYHYKIQHTRNGVMYLETWGTVNISTQYTPPNAVASGVTAPTHITGFAQDGSNGNILRWSTSPETGGSVEFRYKAAGAANWAGSLTVGSDRKSVNLSSLSGTIDYEVRYVRSNGTVYGVGTGRVTINRSVNSSGSVSDTTSQTVVGTNVTPRLRQSVDRWGNTLSMIDAFGNSTTYRYNQFNQLTEIRQPLAAVLAVDGTTGAVSSRNSRPASFNYYDAYGRLIGTRDPNGNVNSVTYNAANQIIAETHADGGVKRFVYNNFGEQIQVTDEAGYRTRNRYDRAGRLIAVAQEVTANAFGTAVPTSIPGFLAAGVVVLQHGYDEAGRRISETSGEVMDDGVTPETTRYWYDLQGNVTRRRTPRGNDTNYGYDELGKKTSEINAIGDSQSWSYDYFGRLRGHVDMGGVIYYYNYNENAGLLVQQTSNRGQSQTYQYDAAGHLIKVTDTGTASGAFVGVNRVTEYTYDAAGRRIRVETTDNGIKHEDTRTQYDALGRISNISGLGYSVNYSYDAAGNRTRIYATYANGSFQTNVQDLWYQYDSMNRVTISQGVNVGNVVTIDTTKGGSDTFTQGTRLTYDLRGMRVTATTRADRLSVNHDQKGYGYYSYVEDETTETYTYDGMGRLVSIALETHEAGALVAPTVIDTRVYDRASRVTSQWNFTMAGAQNEWRERTTTYTDDGLTKEQITRKNGVNESRVVYGDSVFTPGGMEYWYDPWTGEFLEYYRPDSWTLGYDAAGNLRGYLVNVYNTNGSYAYNSTNQFYYAKADGYLETQHTVTNSSGGLMNGSTSRTYNVNNELVQFTDTQDQNRNRYFANNAAGQALTVIRGRYDG